MANEVRLSQVAIEALTDSTPDPGVRLSQTNVEALVDTSPDPDVRLSQAAIEVLVSEPVPAVRISQASAEVLVDTNPDPDVYLSQTAVEVLLADASVPTNSTGIIVQAQFVAGVWADVDDVVSEPGIRIRRGIAGHGPLDTVAGPGEATFSLRNDVGNSGSTLGWYSPRHANVRSGWGIGTPVRVLCRFNSGLYPLFTGKVSTVTPEAGQYRNRRVHVVVSDAMYDLMRVDVRELAIAVNQTDTALFQAIVNAVPSAAQPSFTDFDAAFDTYPYAFDDLGTGLKAAAIVADVARSGGALVYVSRDGALVTRNRQSRAAVTSSFTLDDDMHGLVVTSALDKSFNRVTAITHPKTVGAAPEVLIEFQSAEVIYAGETREYWIEYSNPNLTGTRALIGATGVITPIAVTDYSARSLPSGGGSDLTANVSVTRTAFASVAQVLITNSAASDAYLVNSLGQPFFQVRGTAIYDDGERFFEASSAQLYGDSSLTVDLRYQSDATVGQAFADYYEAEFRDPSPLESVEIVASSSDAFMAQALTREIGDRITVQETVTGVDWDVVIQSVGFDIAAGEEPILRCRWGVAPAPSGTVAPPAPPSGGSGSGVSDLVVTYSGAASGTHNLTTSGELALTTTGDYVLSFSRLATIVAKGAGGGGSGDSSPFVGGGGGGGGASHTTGYSIPLTTFTYGARVGAGAVSAGTVAAQGGDTEFIEGSLSGTVLFQLAGGAGGNSDSGGAGGTMTVGAGGTAGGAGGDGGVTGVTSSSAGASSAAGAGGGGGGGRHGEAGSAGGDGADQTGGIAGADPTPDTANDAEPGVFSADAGGGGAGGGVLIGGVYAGGGGGGSADVSGGTGIPVASGRGGDGVLVIALA